MLVAGLGMAGDLIMAAMVIVSVLLLTALIVWGLLRSDNKIGPLAKAQQEAEIEKMRSEAVLATRQNEVKLAQADAQIIEAKAKAVEAQARADEVATRSIAATARALNNGNGEVVAGDRYA